LLLLASSLNAQDKAFKKQLDSIQKLRDHFIKNREDDLETRISYAKEALVLSKKTGVDSVILNSSIDLAWIYLHDIKYLDKSKKILYKDLKSAYNFKDSINIAYINFLFGHIHSVVGTNSDSIYYYSYNALKYYKNASFSKQSKYKIIQAFTYYIIANLQKDEKDYLGSQTTIIQAINLVLKIPESEESLKFLSDAYNLLGLNLKNLMEYDKSLNYFQKSLDLSSKIQNNFQYKLFGEINMAEVYKKTEDFEKVFEIYDELLKIPDLFEKDPGSYGAILCNMAHTMHLAKDKNTTKIDSLFTKAHDIFEDLQLNYELSSSSNDMSEFYLAANDKDKAHFYANKAYNI